MTEPSAIPPRPAAAAVPERLGVLVLAVLLALAGAGRTSAQAADGSAAAERLYLEAKRLEQVGDPAAALEEYELLVRQFPDDRRAPRALLAVAELYLGGGQREAAGRTLERLVEGYPRSPEAAAGYAAQGRLETVNAHSTAELEVARATLRRVPLLFGRESYPGLEARVEALVRDGELGLVLGDAATAAANFVAALEDEPPGRWTAAARLGLARALLEEERWGAAAEVLQRLAGAAEAGGEDGDAEPARAERFLTLLHRLVLRPAAGQRPWLSSAAFPAAGGLREPVGVAAAEDGRVVVVDDGQPSVSLYASDGQRLSSQVLRDAGRPWWGLDGRAHVVADGSVLRPFDGDRAEMSDPRPGKDGTVKNLLAGERGFFGDWFLLAKGFRSVLTYETPRRGHDRLLATERADPVDLARGPDGRVYVLDAEGPRVVEIGLDRQAVGTVLRGDWKRPTALALDALGNLYVLDRGEGRLHVYDRRGQPLAQVGPQLGGGIELRNPLDVAVDGSGRVFLADPKLDHLVVLE